MTWIWFSLSYRTRVILTGFGLFLAVIVIGVVIHAVNDPTAREFEPAMPCTRTEVYVWTDFDLNRAECVPATDHASHDGR